MSTAMVFLAGFGLLFWWASGRVKESDEARREREDRCEHKPEWQETIRVSDLLSGDMSAANRIIPGRRWLVKRCRGCGRQTGMYLPIQPWDEFVRDFTQESRDREAEYEARRCLHETELASRRNSDDHPARSSVVAPE